MVFFGVYRELIAKHGNFRGVLRKPFPFLGPKFLIKDIQQWRRCWSLVTGDEAAVGYTGMFRVHVEPYSTLGAYQGLQ